MDLALKRFSRQLPALSDARLARSQLPQCLCLMGVVAIHQRCGTSFKYSWNGKRIVFSKLDEWELSDLFKVSRSKWLQLVSALHPDRGGSSELCSRLNALWARIDFLFKRKGVSI